MQVDPRARLKQWLESGEARLQPLSFPQRELWENSPVPVGDPANHICGVIEIKGGLTRQDAEGAVQCVVDRHDAMRTSFLPGKDRPLQMLRSSGSTIFTYRELTSAESKPEALEEIMQEVYRIPFDLMQGPIHRIAMLRRGNNDHALAFSIHHSIADGWSLGVFVQDLCTAYVRGLKGMRKAIAVGIMGLSDSLGPVAQSYVDWAAAERAYWQPAEIEKRLAFWRPHLKDSTRIWTGPRKPPAETPLRRWATWIPAELAKGVRELAAKSGATLFSTLLAGFQLALSKWSGKDDILVGTPVANRGRESTRQTMGYYAGVVPIRGQVDWNQSFSDRLRKVHDTAVDCFANALPFAELAAALGEPRAPGEHSIFDVRFALQNHPVPDVNLPKIATKLRMRSTGTARFDLGCEITEIGPDLEVVWIHRPDRLDRAATEALDSLFRGVLTQACRSPGSLAKTLIP